MTKRIAVVAVVGLLAGLAVPSFAFAQDEQGELGGTETASVPPTTDPEPATTEPPVVPEETEESVTEVETTDVPDTEAVEPQVATSDPAAGASAASSTATVASPITVTKSVGTTAMKSKKSSKATKSGGKKCSTSSRSGGSPIAQASAPPAPGCSRMNGANGQLVLPDGTTLTITSPSQGVIDFTVSGGPTGTFTGTIFVKGGPSDPGNPCVFNGATFGTCNAPVNPNNGKFYGVSHVDACPGTFVAPGTPGTTGGGGSGGGGGGRGGGQRRETDRRGPGADAGTFNPVAAAAVAAPGGQLPVTGLPVIWLVLAGAGLIASGLSLRRVT